MAYAALPSSSPKDFGCPLKSYRASSDGQQNYYFSSSLFHLKKNNKQTALIFPLLLFLDGYFFSFIGNLIGSFTQPNVALHCISYSFN